MNFCSRAAQLTHLSFNRLDVIKRCLQMCDTLKTKLIIKVSDR
jgi:hypothetical protein